MVDIVASNYKRHIWDVEEKRNFNCIKSHYGPSYLVYNLHSHESQQEAADMLFIIDRYIQEIQRVCRNNDSPFCHILGTTKHTVQEMNIEHNKGFEGINKPKDLIKLPPPVPQYFRKDNEYRPSRRHVMLTIRTKTGRIRDFKTIRKLLLHELAHTMCNHCLYRDDGNHESDFKKCESFLKRVTEDF